MLKISAFRNRLTHLPSTYLDLDLNFPKIIHRSSTTQLVGKGRSLYVIKSFRLSGFSKCAEVAQLVEHSPEKAGVDSSILSLGTIIIHPPQLHRCCQQ